VLSEREFRIEKHRCNYTKKNGTAI